MFSPYQHDVVLPVYLDVWPPGDNGQVDGEDDDEDQDAGEQEEPVLPPELNAWNSIS